MAYADFRGLLAAVVGNGVWTAKRLAKQMEVENWYGPDSPELRAYRKLRQDARLRACEKVLKEVRTEQIAKYGANYIRDRLREESKLKKMFGDS
jgi:hypothetical protein